ncbi:immunoglobulin domain-containing protein [Gabonibacter chumensis]|uniref:immunoglobulin domain-containing protein n=1 Tax=Gabonibacter chumensis TaxID=2972474 RepID=UPI0025743BE6|nr:immunoglobulin domain-containing protein [Gabonibacter chumensis]MCR9011771.1 immunoglobulin domain-containing protein [Gabonibacter chumensis]
MKKKIVFIIMLIIATTGSYISITNAANARDEMPKFTSDPSSQDVEESATLQIDVVVVGTPTPEVRWYKGDRRIYEDERTSINVNGQRHTLTILGVKRSDAGTYNVIAENTIGMAKKSCYIFIISKPYSL